jgi:hypothetical protein
MGNQEKRQSAIEVMGQMYAVSLLPFVGGTIGTLMAGWKFKEAATAGLWAGPGSISVMVIAYYSCKAVRIVWSDIYSVFPSSLRRVLDWTAGLLIVAFLVFALFVTLTKSTLVP